MSPQDTSWVHQRALGKALTASTTRLLCPVLFLLPPSVWACPTGTVEAKLGVGSVTKVGFTCNNNCDKAFYRTSNDAGWVSEVRHYSSDTHVAHQETFTGWANSVIISDTVNPLTCSQSNTATNGTSSYTHFSAWSRTWNESTKTWDGGACESDTFNPADCTYYLVNPAGMTLISSNREVTATPCGTYIAQEILKYRDPEARADYTVTVRSSDDPGYGDEYTTTSIIGKAQACALNQLSAASTFSAAVPASCLTWLADDQSSTSFGAARWRVAIRGTRAGEQYKIYLNFIITEHGTNRTEVVEDSIDGSDQEVWYYPNESAGQTLWPPDATNCGSMYQKHLVTADIEPKSASCTGASCVKPGLIGGTMPGWGTSPGSSGCSSCGSGTGGPLDIGTFFTLDLGVGDHQNFIGTLSLAGLVPSPSLATPVALEAAFNPFSADAPGVLRDGGALRQVSAPHLFINVSNDTAYLYTIRVMSKAAQGQLTNGLYLWNDNPAYLIKRYTIENPDASPTVYNRLRIRDVTSGTVEWLFTYSNAISGWTVTLPGNAGFADLISTNHATNAWTYLRRYRNPSGQTLYQQSQVFTNFPWGPAMLSETLGVGSEARTRSITYYDPPPFTPISSRTPIRTVLEPDGAWRTVTDYDTSGRVSAELSGISTGVTNDTSQCRRLVYSYQPQHQDDNGTRSPDSPRKEEEYWKDQLVRRTYYVFSSQSASPQFDSTIQCPNPNNAIGNAENLVNSVYYYPGTSLVQYTIHPDGTVEVPLITYDPYLNKVTTVDQGEPYPYAPSFVYYGTRTVTVTSPAGARLSEAVWALSQAYPGALLSSNFFSGFDEFNRPTRVDYLDGTYETYSYSCCGLDLTSDRSGALYQMNYDVMHRPLGQIALSVSPVISTTNSLDTAGRIAATVRNGGGSWPIVQSQRAYDTAGRLVLETNALNGVTGHTETLLANNLRQEVSVRPDGGSITNRYLPDGSLSEVSGSAAFPTRYEYGVETDAGAARLYTKEIKLDVNGNATEWVKRYQDGLGRTYKTVYAAASGSPTSYAYFNSLGQLVKEVDPDGVTTLSRYDGQGRRVITAVDLNQDGYVADYDPNVTGKDRVSQTTVQYLASGDQGNTRGTDIQRTATVAWTTDNSATTATVTTTDVSTDGLHTWQVSYRDQNTPVETRTDITIPTSANNWTRTVTQTAPDNSTTTSVYHYGRLLSVTRKDASDNQLAAGSYSYDAHGRQSAVTDARNGATTYSFNNADQVILTTSPDLGTGPEVSVTFYDTMGRTTGLRHPDNTSTTNLYFPTGLLQSTSGSRTYAVEYTYEAQGRMRTMKTWQSFPSGGTATTRWNYDPYRGWLKSKDYPDPTTGAAPGSEGTTGPLYGYTPAGRLHTRAWRRLGSNGNTGILTTYTYGFDDGASGNEHGDIVQVAYSNDPASTPAVTYTFDRRGRRSQVTQNGMTAALAFDDASQQTGESYTGGTLGGVSLSWGYNSLLQREALSLAGITGSYSLSYGYENGGRLQTVSEGNSLVTYSYLANSPLVGQITFAQSGTTRMVTTKQYDRLNRLLSTSSAPPGSASFSSFSYVYNSANQRTRATLADGSHWLYTYDRLGQVISGKRFWLDGTPVAGQQFEYAFDDIGNRRSTAVGGDATGGGLRYAAYSANRLNQYSQRDVPGALDILGIANPTTAVTVNGSTAYRKGDYFHFALPVSNSGGPQYPSITVASSYPPGQTNTGNLFVPKTSECFTNDADGNLTQDGRWTYSWDGENRLVQLVARTGVGPQQLIKFDYDWQGRRIRKRVWDNTGGTNDPNLDQRFVYDGWNLIATLNSQLSTLNFFLWGLDLSGSLQGAGGVGGLLRVTYNGAQTTNCFAAFDGNGNVTGLADASSGAVAAQYEYGPFGELLRATGPTAKVSPFRFSTKYEDDETDLLYYGYRYYNPRVGRWISRDPLQEFGFSGFAVGNSAPLILEFDKAEYVFLTNLPITRNDFLGLKSGGALCYCLAQWRPGIALDNFDNQGKPIMDGAPLCQKDAVGKTATRTVSNGCINRMFTPELCYDCTKLSCLIQGDFKCSRIAPDKYRWVSTGTARVVRNCK